MMEKKPEWKEVIPAWKKFIRVFCIVIIVMGCVNTCVRHGRTPKSVTMYYGPSDYAEVEQLLDNGSFEEAVEFCMNELEKTQKGSDEEAALYMWLGESYGSIGDREQTVMYLERAIAIARKNNNQPLLATICYSMSKVYMFLGGDMEEGLEYAREAEELYRNEFGDNAIETENAVLNQGILYFNEDQWENALERLELAEKISESRQRVNWSTCILIGRAYTSLQKYEEAEEAILKAKEASEKIENDYYCARSSLWLGYLYMNMEEYGQAIDSFEEALEFFETDPQYPRERATLYHNSGYCRMQESGNWEDGILYGIKACQAVEETGDTSEEIEEDREDFKQKLKEWYYDEWKQDATDDEYEAWYQRVVLDGEDWEEE